MDAKTEAITNQLSHQRNREADAVAMLCGEIAERDEKISKLTAEIAALKEPAKPEAEIHTLKQTKE